MSDWFVPAGSSKDGDFEVRIEPGRSGWQHAGLYVTTLAAGESRTVSTGEREWIVLPMSGGGVRVEVEGRTYELAGRQDVFSGSSDLVYVPRGGEFTVTSIDGGRIALPFAQAKKAYPVVKVEARDVPIELRGAGQASRQVHNFGTPATLEADSIIACEVITPAGNWSSYPPHKHDEERAGEETSLEEIYYFEMRTQPGGPSEAKPFGYQRVYGTEERPIDVLEEVRAGDAVLVPHGWHGPSMAPTGYDMYYLNVMAGPGESRAWLICDDPSHSWVRDTWAGQEVDPRLPLHAV